jgi:hypothetical protein
MPASPRAATLKPIESRRIIHHDPAAHRVVRHSSAEGAFFLPSSIVGYVAACFWNRLHGSAWHGAVEDAFCSHCGGTLSSQGALAILEYSGIDPLAGG